jgi:hypothetical protein
MLDYDGDDFILMEDVDISDFDEEQQQQQQKQQQEQKNDPKTTKPESKVTSGKSSMPAGEPKPVVKKRITAPSDTDPTAETFSTRAKLVQVSDCFSSNLQIKL